MGDVDLETYLTEFGRRDWLERDVEGTLRVAVVGLGAFARDRALPAIAGAAHCDLTTLVSGSEDKAERLAGAYGADHVLGYDAFRAGDRSDAYDAVYVATPNRFHAEYVEAAARLGKHAICEKPLATTPEEAERMIAACERADVTLMTAYRLQTEPAVRRMRELLAEGVVGDPVHVSGGFSNRIVDDAGWRMDESVAGGGALVDLGIYPLNTARFLLSADPVAARATTVERDGAGVDEHVSFLLEFPDGITASCVGSFLAHHDSRLQVLGTDGRIAIDSPFGGAVRQDLVVERGETRVEYTGEPVDEVAEEFEYFAHCVLTGQRPEPDGADGLADLRVVEAVYDSAERGERVAVEP